MLEQSMKEQLKGIFAGLKNVYTLVVRTTQEHPKRVELIEMIKDLSSTSPDNIKLKEEEGECFELEILRNDESLGIIFRAIPGGHEFTSLLMVLLNADDKGKNIPDATILDKIKSFDKPISLTTYMSLTCTNCPDVVQIINMMAIFNKNISHEIVDGAMFPDEVKEKGVQAVPTVFANGEVFHIGRSDLGELLQKMEKEFGGEIKAREEVNKEYDLVVVGGGPAGSAAAIYSARKGLKVAIVAERIGGQVKETQGIENLISVPETTGTKLAEDLSIHIKNYDIDVLEHRKAVEIVNLDTHKIVKTNNLENLKTPSVIIATGASWRKLGVKGEEEYIGRGVAFCPHCDGPFYKGKRVAVIGGGNSGIEAAIDLSGICSHVTVLEFMPDLVADKVLQDKANSISNIDIHRNMQTLEIDGDGAKVVGIKVKNRETEEEIYFDLDGIFVQIGLSPNSGDFSSLVETNKRREIIIDERCRTNVAGIYAAGDVSTVPYKQIIIAMGEGAKAALTAFDDRMRGLA